MLATLYQAKQLPPLQNALATFTTQLLGQKQGVLAWQTLVT